MIIRRIGEIAREQGLASGRAEKAELINAIQRKQGNFDRLATASNGGGDRTGCLWRKIVWPRPGSGRIPEAGGIGEAKEVPCF